MHAPHWPLPRAYEPQLPLSPPAVAATLQWESLPLSAGERAHKLAALEDHRSQMQVMGSFMQSFVRANELFARPGN